MNLPRVRFTVRRMMVAVAACALLVQAGRLVIRSQTYQQKALFYARAGGTAAARARNVESGVALLPGYTAPEKQKVVDQARDWVTHAAQREAKYRRAARYPWLPVAADETTGEADLR